MPELSSVVESAKTEYQGKVLEINLDDSSRNRCYLSDGKSVMESHEEDPGWWEEAVKFADSIENIEHTSDLCTLVSSPIGSRLLILLCSFCPAVMAYFPRICRMMMMMLTSGWTQKGLWSKLRNKKDPRAIHRVSGSRIATAHVHASE